MIEQYLEQLAAASRRYGANPQFVFGGGGNTSVKDETHLYVKPSGVELGSLQAGQLVQMTRAAIRAFFTQPTPAEPAAREALVKQAMAAAVVPTSKGRPSVEAPVHELFPQRFVIHTHSLWLNGLLCARDSAATAARLFPTALYVEYIDPGYTLACVLAQRIAAYTTQHGQAPAVVLLENHGVFVAGDTIEAIDALYTHLMGTITAAYTKEGISTDITMPAVEPDDARGVAPRLRTLLGNATRRAAVHAGPAFAPADGPLTPDHIVYAKSFAYNTFSSEISAADLAAFKAQRGYAPLVVAVLGQATFAVEANLKSARLTLQAAWNAHCVQRLAATFGGPRYLDDRQRGFIENWEVESYRKALAAGGGAAPQRLDGKICLVTGGAQGFGLGICQGLAANGATVIVADLNLAGATTAEQQLEAKHGPGRAFAVAVNVADEASVHSMVDRIVLECGGLDVLVSNAGVLRAGSVKSMTVKDWDFVTAVNYTGYFLCVKHVAPVMAGQKVGELGGWMDIINLNSKSGLQGSNKNAAYAGSKFGDIGLTQSFALELIEDHIKVNAICPGNYLDGPLWCDPEKGLFVQYLKTNKVPGAKTIEDVKRFYESKVPMNRGCRPEDVVTAILYCIEQAYETGQAIPVTGGQVMLA